MTPIVYNAVADAGADITDAAEGDLVEIQGQAVNPNATPIYEWSYTGTESLDLTGVNTATLSFQTGEYLVDTTFEFELKVTVGTATNKDLVLVTVLADNDAPTFTLPAERTVSPSTSVNLAAVSVNDPEDQPLSYSWEPALLNSVVVDDFTADNETATFTAPTVPAGQTLELTYVLTVSDGVNEVPKAIKVIIPSNAIPNVAPTAVISPIAGNSVAEGGTATLDGSGSNDDTTESANLVYAWLLLTDTAIDLGLSAAELSQSSFSFTAPNLANDLVLELQLIVTDEQGEPSVPATYSLIVQGVNDAPSVTAKATPATASAGTLVTLTASTTNSDIDQAAISYSYAWTAPAGYENLLSNTTGSSITFTAPSIANATPLNFSVIATEAITGGLVSDSAVATVIIQEGYFPPVAVAEVVGGGATLEEGITATLTAANSQQNTNSITSYLWETDCAGTLADETQAVASFTPVQALADSSCNVDLTVSDGTADGVSRIQLPVTIAADNDAPVATSPAAALSAMATMPIVLAGITVNDVDTPIADLTYTWTSDNNAVLQALSSTTAAQPTFTPPSFADDTLITFTLTVSDGGEAGRSAAQNAVSTSQLQVQVAGNNDTPNPQIVLTAPLDAAAISEDSMVTLTATAVAGSTSIDRFTTDAELIYTWTPNAALAALGVSPLTGVGLKEFDAVLPPLEAPISDLAVTLVVEDAQQATSTVKTFTFVADASNEAPELTINGPSAVASNSSVVLEAIATDPEALRTLTYVWQQIDANGNALAANDPLAIACSEGNTTSQCSFSAPLFNANQDLSWQVTATEAGTEAFLLSTTSTKTFTVTSGYIAPELTLSSLAPTNEGDSVTITATLSTPGTAAINTYDWSQSTCLDAPVLADFSAVTGNTLTFIAPAQQKADYICDITLNVTDATNNIIEVTPLALTINAIDDLPVAAIAERSLSITGYDPEDITDEILDGSVTAADEEGDTLIYQWTQDPTDTVQVNWLTRGEDNGIAFFTVEQQAAQTQLNFSLTVCDAPNDPQRCDATPETITITVTATNQPPIAIITVDDVEIVGADADNGSVTVLETEHPAQRPNGEMDVIVKVSAAQSSDPAPSNGTLTYKWSLSLDSNFDLGNYTDANAWAEGELGLTAADFSAESFSFTTPNFASSQDLLFVLTVSDGELSVAKDLTITVEADNDVPPKPVINDLTSSSFRVGEATVLSLLNPPTMDPEGQPILRSWAIVDGNGTLTTIDSCGVDPNICNFTSNSAGQYEIVAVAKDNVNAAPSELAISDSVILTYQKIVPSNPPEILYRNDDLGGLLSPFEELVTRVALGGEEYDYVINQTFGSGNVVVSITTESGGAPVLGLDDVLNRITYEGPGVATVTFTELANEVFEESSVSYRFDVPEPEIDITVNSQAVTQLTAYVNSPPIEYGYSISFAGRFPRLQAISSNENIVTIDTQSGLITPGSVAGQATITFTLVDFPDATETVVTFTNNELLVNTMYFYEGSEITSITCDSTCDASDLVMMGYQNGGGLGGKFTFVSSSPDIVEIQSPSAETGNFTVYGKKAGQSTITATRSADDVYAAVSVSFVYTVPLAPNTIELLDSTTQFDYVNQETNFVGNDKNIDIVIGNIGSGSGIGGAGEISVVSSQDVGSVSWNANSITLGEGKAGSTTITVSRTADDQYDAASVSFIYTVRLDDTSSLSIVEVTTGNAPPAIVRVGDAAINLTLVPSDEGGGTGGIYDMSVDPASSNVVRLNYTAGSKTATLDIIGAGTATITASRTADDIYAATEATYTITVEAPKPTLNVTLDSQPLTTLTMFIGDDPLEFSFNASNYSQFASFTVDSSDSSVVTGTLNAPSYIIPGTVPGTATLTIFSDEYPSVTWTINVEIKAKPKGEIVNLSSFIPNDTKTEATRLAYVDLVDVTEFYKGSVVAQEGNLLLVKGEGHYGVYNLSNPNPLYPKLQYTYQVPFNGENVIAADIADGNLYIAGESGDVHVVPLTGSEQQLPAGRLYSNLDGMGSPSSYIGAPKFINDSLYLMPFTEPKISVIELSNDLTARTYNGELAPVFGLLVSASDFFVVNNHLLFHVYPIGGEFSRLLSNNLDTLEQKADYESNLLIDDVEVLVAQSDADERALIAKSRVNQGQYITYLYVENESPDQPSTTKIDIPIIAGSVFSDDDSGVHIDLNSTAVQRAVYGKDNRLYLMGRAYGRDGVFEIDMTNPNTAKVVGYYSVPLQLNNSPVKSIYKFGDYLVYAAENSNDVDLSQSFVVLETSSLVTIENKKTMVNGGDTVSYDISWSRIFSTINSVDCEVSIGSCRVDFSLTDRIASVEWDIPSGSEGSDQEINVILSGPTIFKSDSDLVTVQ